MNAFTPITPHADTGENRTDGAAAAAGAAEDTSVAITAAASAFTLELLHFSDPESPASAVQDAPRMSAVLNALRAQDIGEDGEPDNTLTIASGDLFLGGVFFNASEAVFGSRGIADIQIMNEFGVQASALGNHDFDFGTQLLANLITGAAAGDFGALDGSSLDGQDFTGTAFPYLSANLAFSTDPNLAPLEVPGGQAPLPNTVTSSVVIEVNGEPVGVVGATTPTLGSISSPGAVGIQPQPFDATPTPEQLDALAAIIQDEVDVLLATNPELNKVILSAHMQRLDIELALAERLENVDIIIAGGSNTRLFDDGDRPRPGDSDQGQYPQFVTNAGGTTTAVVNTDGSYKYVGRLVIDFDEQGHIVPSSYDADVSGAYATDAEGVAELGAEGLVDPEVQAIADAIEAQVIATESNVFGISDVFLNGERLGLDTPDDPDGVRTQETNLGNLTADANLFAAQREDPDVLVSIKNGGGVRESIGQVLVPAGGSEAVRLPNEALVDSEGNVIKPEGGISQNDIETTLAFNNGLTLVTLTKAELVDILEHGVSALPVAAGAFAQVGGLEFSFEPDLPMGERVVNAAIIDGDGTVIAPLMRNGEIAGDPTETFRVVTLNFLVEPNFDDDGNFVSGGDGYPFPNLNTDPAAGEIGDPDVIARANVVQLTEEGERTGAAQFADDGSEQDALAEYLADNFATGETAFDEVDTGRAEDERIQNLNFRADAVFGPAAAAVVISELMYNPASAEDDWEWVEITNVGDSAVDLTGWVIDDGNSVFQTAANIAGGVVEAGESAVLYNADDLTADAFAAAWGEGLNLIGVTNWGAMALNNGGDTVAIWSSLADYQGDEAAFANAVDSVVYTDGGEFPDVGGAESISLTDLAAVNDDGASWAASAAGAVTPTGTGRVADAEGGNSGADIGSPGGKPEDPGIELPDPELAITVAGTLELDGAEIVAFDRETGRAFVTSGGGLHVVDASDIANLSLVTTLEAEALGFDASDVTSVAVAKGIVAVARPDMTKTDTGQVLFYDAGTLQFLGTVQVGPLPDMLTFNEDGTVLLVANEGESASEDNLPGELPNPLGSVSVIEVNPANPTISTVTTLDFSDASITFDALAAKGVRVNRDAPSAAADIEPEYITIKGNKAFITLQEANAVAVIDDITDPQPFTIDSIQTLGVQDHSTVRLDPSNRDGGINLANYDIVGLRQADGIASYEVDGVTYYVTANEGDTREVDESRGADLVDGDPSNGEVDPDLDPTLLAQLADEALLGRLTFSNVDGDVDGDGDGDVLHSFGSRSFTIFDEFGDVVFDSGDDFETITAALVPEIFNADESDPEEFDDRSDDKGPEPESVELGVVDGQTYAFIGLERTGGVMVYDVTNPTDVSFEQYILPGMDIAPEGLEFIAAEDSPTGNALLAVASEGSGTLTFHEIAPVYPTVEISQIQGAGHVSALAGQTVKTTGIVTAVDTNGYYLQDPTPDEDDATSEAIFVFTSSAPGVAVGDEVRVKGTVSEFIPGGSSSGNLSITQITSPETSVLSSGNPLPAATVIGAAGRTPPTEVVISRDELPVNLQTDPGQFDPEEDGIDFYESLEGMRVTVDDPVVISPTNRFDETWVVGDDGANTVPALNARGALPINADADGYGDLNPEKIQLQYDSGLLPDGFTPPLLEVGDNLSDVTGVVSYAFGNYEVLVTEPFQVDEESRLEPEVVSIGNGPGELTVATYNVLNLTANVDGSTNDDDQDAAQIALLAEQIVGNLGSPDILALQEVQDDSGVTDDGTLSADATLQALVDAIAAAGGPTYAFESAVVDVDGETGGVPGGNIRNAFLYDPARVDAVAFQTLDVAELTALGVSDPNAFEGTRDPFLGVFEFQGEQIALVNNHFSSRSGSTPIFGGPQPFEQEGEAAREAQAKAVNQVVDAILAGVPDANVVVLGDLNTFEFTDELTEDLPGTGDEQVLTNLITQVPEDDAYTFIFDGNAQVLDHVFVTDGLLAEAEIDVVHVNTDFLVSASDHEPIVVSFRFERKLISGTEGNDELVGTEGGDILDGLGGNDRYTGLGGSDVFVLGAGDRDRVEDFVIGEDLISAANWGTQSLDELLIVGGNGRLLIRDEVTGDLALVRDTTGMLDRENLTALDFVFAPAENLVLLGTDGNESLTGRSGDDLFDGGPGRDVYTGNAGADTFVLGTGDADAVLDFEDGTDLLDISGWGVASFDQLLAADVGSSRIFVSDGENAAVIRSEDPNLSIADLSGDDFLLGTGIA